MCIRDSYFSRFFKAKENCTPMEYRMRNGQSRYFNFQRQGEMCIRDSTRGTKVFTSPSFDHVMNRGICVTCQGIIIVARMSGKIYFAPFQGIFVRE